MNQLTIDAICATFAEAVIAPEITGLGYRAWQDDEINVLCLHEAVTEWYGGAHDGEHLIQGFGVSISGMLALFDEPPEIHLDATLPAGDDEEEDEIYNSPSVSLTGAIEGQPWLVRICTAPPADVEADLATNGIQFWRKT